MSHSRKFSRSCSRYLTKPRRTQDGPYRDRDRDEGHS